MKGQSGAWGCRASMDLPDHPTNNHFRMLCHGAKGSRLREVSKGRLAINSVEYGGRSASAQDGFTLQGDRRRAKWSTAYVEIPRALLTGHLDLRSGVSRYSD